MNTFKVLYGFKSEKTDEGVTREIASYGYKVAATVRTTKQTIKDFVEKHPDLDAVILKEYLDGGGKYSSAELCELSDISNTNFVVVLATAHRGRDAMKDLYANGIINAYFSDKVGANPEVLAELAVKGRTRKAAREYYKIEERRANHDILAYEDFRDCYKYLIDKREGINLVDRFVTISKWLYPGQMADFIKFLPDKAYDYLLQYEEFYQIYGKLQKSGYLHEKLKRQKDVRKGIDKEGSLEKLVSETRHERAKASEVEEVPIEPVHTDPFYMPAAKDNSYDEAELTRRQKPKKTSIEELGEAEDEYSEEVMRKRMESSDEDIYNYARREEEQLKEKARKEQEIERKKAEKEKALERKKAEKEKKKKEKTPLFGKRKAKAVEEEEEYEPEVSGVEIGADVNKPAFDMSIFQMDDIEPVTTSAELDIDEGESEEKVEKEQKQTHKKEKASKKKTKVRETYESDDEEEEYIPEVAGEEIGVDENIYSDDAENEYYEPECEEEVSDTEDIADEDPDSYDAGEAEDIEDNSETEETEYEEEYEENIVHEEDMDSDPVFDDDNKQEEETEDDVLSPADQVEEPKPQKASESKGKAKPKPKDKARANGNNNTKDNGNEKSSKAAGSTKGKTVKEENAGEIDYSSMSPEELIKILGS